MSSAINPDFIYRMLSQVSITDREIVAMRAEVVGPHRAHHVMVEAIRTVSLPASRLPMGCGPLEAQCQQLERRL